MSFTLRPRFLPDRDALKEWGGKGSTLVRLIRKGFRVPPTAAFGISEVREWLDTLGGAGSWEPARLEALRAAIAAAPMPEHWPRSCETMKSLLCGKQEWPLIFRSSMSVEDSGTHSLAGCYESVKVESAEPVAVWDAFRRVVASAYSPAAIERMEASGIDPREFGAAVVIQPYLRGELSGVCFSRDPSDPWSSDGAIEWVRGEGEQLVQGTADAESARFSETPVALAPFRDELVSRARIAEKILGKASGVERMPADLEWAWDGEQLWFLQARPIATEEARLAARSPSRRWSRELTEERFPEPLSPMGWSVLQDAFSVNLSSLSRRFGVVARAPEDMAVSVRGIVYSDPKFFAYPSGVSVRWSQVLAPWKRAPWLAAWAGFRFVGRALTGRGGAVSRALLGLDLADAFLGGEAGAIDRSWEHLRDHELARVEKIVLPPAGAGASEVLSAMDGVRAISLEFMEPDLAVFLVKDTLFRGLQGLWRALGRAEGGFTDLVRSFDGNRTLEMNREFAEAAAAIARDPEREEFCLALGLASDRASGFEAGAGLGEEARVLWERFLRRNGHSTTSWDVAVPTWADEPARLWGLVRSAVRAPASGAVKASGLNLRAKSREEFLEALRAAGLAGRSAWTLRMLARLERFMVIDEEHHFLSGVLLPPSRALILAGGAELTRAGVLARAEDAFCLTIDELRAALAQPVRKLAPLARRRRSEWERAAKQAAPERLPCEVRNPNQTVGTTDGFLGIAASPGIIEGTALVADHLDQVGEIAPGSILVTTSPNPALTPLYPLLAGLVSATGGALSHGFVAAREYALPAVSGIRQATQVIPNGARIRVDGTTGKVTLL